MAKERTEGKKGYLQKATINALIVFMILIGVPVGLQDLGLIDIDKAYAEDIVGKADISPTVTMNGWTYGGAAGNPNVSGNLGNGEVTYEYKVKDADDSTYTATKPSNAGDYTVRATIAETDSYKGGTATADFTIAKAANTINNKNSWWSCAYDYKAPGIHTLVVGRLDNCIQDAIGAVSFEITSRPNSYFNIYGGHNIRVYGGLLPGEYNVYIKATAAGDANHNAGSCNIRQQIIIKRLRNNISYADQSWSPIDSTDAQTTELDAAANAKGTVNYSISSQPEGGYFSLAGRTLTMNAGTPHGTYTVKVKATDDGGDIYTGSEAESTVTVTVGKWANPITYPDQSWSPTYKTEGQTTELAAATDAQGTVTYTITSQRQGITTVKYFSNDGRTLKMASDTPAGTYMIVVKAKAAGNGKYNSGEKYSTVTVTVEKADISPTVTMKGWTYGGTANDPIVSGNLGGGEVTYEYKVKDAEDSTYTDTKPSNAGTYTVRATIAETANYNGGTATADFTIAEADEPVKPVVQLKDNPLTVKGRTAKVKYSKLKTKKQTLAIGKVVSFTGNGQGQLSYLKTSGNKKISINKSTGKITIKKGLKKGTYKVKVKVSATGNAEYKPAVKVTTLKIKVK